MILSFRMTLLTMRVVGAEAEDSGGKRKREPRGSRKDTPAEGGGQDGSSNRHGGGGGDEGSFTGCPFLDDPEGYLKKKKLKKRKVVGPRAQAFLEVEEVEPDMTLSEDDKEAWPLVRKAKAGVVGLFGPTAYFDEY